MKKIIFASAIFASCAVLADADVLNRPAGIKVGERLTLRPYVSFSYSYDSNVNSTRDSGGDNGGSYWTANPGVGLDYVGGNWNINGSVYYQYHAYSGNQDERDNSSYGEQLGITWSNIGAGDNSAGWGLTISERYAKVDQSDDFSHSDGYGLWRNRQQFDMSMAVQHRFNERWHISANASWYVLDYENDVASYAPLFGWGRYTVGGQIGYTASPWTDIFISGNYQGYKQDNDRWGDRGSYGDESSGWTAHVGLGSHMTERINYRLSAGVSNYKQGDNGDRTGFTYQGNLSWKFAETWSTTLLLSSYYQPSEREVGASTRCDSVSWGLAKSLVRGKLTSTFDVAYRHDTTSDYEYSDSDWALNIITAQLGVNYSLNRLFSVFGRCEYQTELNSGDEIYNHYDYNRWRLTVGFRLSY